jgi:cytochrome c biogenesis protein CcmG, thiol:disulfide interchange protein DsbE
VGTRRSSRRLPVRGLIALAAVALVLVAGVFKHAPAKDRRAPSLHTRAVAGSPSITLAQLRGHTVAVVFFASWCGDCHKEAAAVARFAATPAGSGHVVAVDYSDGGNWRGFLQEYGWRFPVFADRNGTIGDAFHIDALPTTVFLNAQGVIVATSESVQSVSSLKRALAAAA